MLCARRHVEALDQLEPQEIATLGPPLAAASAALRAAIGCEKTYVFLSAARPGTDVIVSLERRHASSTVADSAASAPSDGRSETDSR